MYMFSTRKSELTDSASVLDNFKFLESAAADFSDEDEDDDVDGREKSIIDTSTVSWITSDILIFRDHYEGFKK